MQSRATRGVAINTQGEGKIPSPYMCFVAFIDYIKGISTDIRTILPLLS